MTNNGWAVLAMHGMPGVGKTAFATELWGRLAPLHPGQHAFVRWDPSSGEPTTAALVRRLLVELHVPEQELLGAKDEFCERQLRNILHDRSGHLIVIDGLTKGISQVQLDRLLDLIKTSASTVILVSRTKPTGYVADQLFEVRPLTTADSTVLARSLLGDEAELEYPTEFAEVIRACGGLPRALDAACRRVSGPTSLADVSKALQDPAQCLPFLLTDGHDLGVELASEYAGLTDDHRRVLGAVSLLCSRTVGARAVSVITGIGVRAAEELLAELEDARLLAADQPGVASPEPRYVQHRLVGLALHELNAEACQEFELDRGVLYRGYVKRVREIYDEWGHELGASSGASEKVLEFLRYEYRDVLAATLEAHRRGGGKPCWQLGHMITGLFPIVSCDWPMWEEFFSAAQQAAERDGAVGASVSALQGQGLVALLSGGLSKAEPMLLDSLTKAMERATYDADVQIRSYVHLAESEMERGLYTDARAKIADMAPISDPRPYDADHDWAKFVSAVVDRNLQEGMWYQIGLLAQARIELKDVKDPTRTSRMHLYTGDAMREVGQGLDAENEYHRTWELAESVGDAFMAARASYSAAMLLLDWKEVPRAATRRLVRIIKPAYEASRDPLWMDRYAYLCARLKFEEEEHQDCVKALTQLFERLKADPRDKWLYTNTALLLAQTHFDLDRPQLAQAVLDSSMPRFRDAMNTQALARAHSLLGHINVQSKNRRRAREEFKKAVDLFRGCGDDRGEYSARKELARSSRGPGLVSSGRQRFRVRRLDLRRNIRRLQPPTGRPLGVPVLPSVEPPLGHPVLEPGMPAHGPGHERTGPFQYTVLVCHDEADKELVRPVIERFQAARIPAWVPGDQIRNGEGSTQRYEEGLRISEHVVVCVTSRLRTTGWAEAGFAPHLLASLNGHPGRKVIPLLLGDGTVNDIPLLLAGRTPVTFGTEGFDTLIAELRVGGA